jgi:hypothetical protein
MEISSFQLFGSNPTGRLMPPILITGPLKFQRFFIKLGAEFLPLGNKKFKNPG